MLRKYLPFSLFFLAGCLFLFIPLLRDFHFESAILFSVIGCFWSALVASKKDAKQDFFTALRILGFVYLAGLPLFVNALITGCLTFDGFGFWLMIPLPSIFLGAAIGRLVRKFQLPFPLFITTTILIFCAVGIWLFELFSFPQVYFYNHIWGVWPGPIYDEAVEISSSFFFFRGITFLWVVLLWMLPSWNKNTQHKLITGLAALSLLLSYLNLDEMGIISPRESIQQQLSGSHHTEHFTLFFDADFFTEDEVEYWAKRHEFYFQQITHALEIDWPEDRKIESYLYAHAWQKKKITGAKFTSYVPVWLSQDQTHIAKQHLDDVLKHELVHVISKQFGNRLLNASFSIGLIEGLAEAIAKDASTQSTLHQIVAAEKPYPTAEEMKSSLSIAGFYQSAGAISYTTAGSFVDYLLEEYPAQNFKKAYPTGDFEEAYNRSFDELVSGWHQQLDATVIDSVDLQISEFIFAQRSLFQKTCPHSVSRELQLWDDYRFLLAEEDTIAASHTLDELFSIDRNNELVHAEWMRAKMRTGNYEEAARFDPEPDSLLTLKLLYADALFLNEQFKKADSVLQAIAPAIQKSDAINFRHSLELRNDRFNWQHHTQRRYKNYLPDSTEFANITMANKVQSLNKALELNNDQKLLQYSSLLAEEPANVDFFLIYHQHINRLIFLHEFELAEKWLRKLQRLNLRLRHRQMLQENNEWLEFCKLQLEN